MAYSIYMYFSPELLSYLDKYTAEYPRLTSRFDLTYERVPINNELFTWFKPRGDDRVIREYLDECLRLPKGFLLTLAEDDVLPEYCLLHKKLSADPYTSLMSFYKENP